MDPHPGGVASCYSTDHAAYWVAYNGRHGFHGAEILGNFLDITGHHNAGKGGPEDYLYYNFP